MKRPLSLLLVIVLLTPGGSGLLAHVNPGHGPPARACASCTMERGTHHCPHCSRTREPAGSCVLRDDGCGGTPKHQSAMFTGSLFHDAALAECAGDLSAPAREGRMFAIAVAPATQRAPDHTDPPPKGAPTES